MIRQFVVCLFICLFGSVMTESDELENTKSSGMGKFKVNHVIFSSWYHMLPREASTNQKGLYFPWVIPKRKKNIDK